MHADDVAAKVHKSLAFLREQAPLARGLVGVERADRRQLCGAIAAGVVQDDGCRNRAFIVQLVGFVRRLRHGLGFHALLGARARPIIDGLACKRALVPCVRHFGGGGNVWFDFRGTMFLQCRNCTELHGIAVVTGVTGRCDGGAKKKCRSGFRG